MVHTALIVASLAMAAAGLLVYLWDTRHDRREFARRVERAQRLYESGYGGRMPRGRPRG